MTERERRFLAFDHRLRFYARIQMEVQCRVAEVLCRMREGENLLKVGFVRFDDYAYEVVGLHARAALDLVWLHRKLPGYPCVEKAWRDGALYWSHVQLLLRHVKPEEEAAWVARARHLTVRGLKQALQSDRPVEELDAKPGFWLQVSAPPKLRAEWQTALELASRMVGRNIQPYECLDMAITELMASPLLKPDMDLVGDEKVDLEGWREWLREEARKARVELEEAREEEARAWESLPSSMPACEVPEVPGEGASAFELDTYLRHLVAWAGRRERGLVEGLGQFDFERLWREFNFVDVVHYAAERLGMSRSQVGDILYIYRRLPFVPEVAEAFEQGRLTRTQVRMLLRIATVGTAAEWVAYARQVPIRELSRAVEKGMQMRQEHPYEPVLPPDLDRIQTSAQTVAADVQASAEGGADVVSGIQTSAPGGEDPGPSSAEGPESEDESAAAGASATSGIQTSAQGGEDPGPSSAEGAGNSDDSAAQGGAASAAIQTSARPSGVRVPSGWFVLPSDLVGSIRIWVPSELEWYVEMGLKLARLNLGAQAEMSECFQLIVSEFLKEYRPLAEKMAKAHKVVERDEWRCQVPGCSNRSNLQVHHVEFRSHGGALEPWNEVTLCRAHHLKALHEGFIKVKGKAPYGLTWVLGVMPGGESYHVYEGPRQVRRGRVA